MKQQKHPKKHARPPHTSQHWIPRTYLRSWIPDSAGRQIHVYSRNRTPLGRQYARGLFQEDDMYTRTGRDGSRDISIEKGLGALETQFGPLLPKLEQHQELSTADSIHFLAFVCAMNARTPTQRERDRNHMAACGAWLATSNRV